MQGDTISQREAQLKRERDFGCVLRPSDRSLARADADLRLLFAVIFASLLPVEICRKTSSPASSACRMRSSP